MRPPRPSRCRSRWLALLAEERGTAALEFVIGGVLMLVPLLYLVIALGTLQGQTLGVEAAARHLARTLANGNDAAADRVVAAIASQYGVEPSTLTVTVACTPSAQECPAPGAMLTVTVQADASLPLVPPLLGLDQTTRVPLSATVVQKVSSWPAS